MAGSEVLNLFPDSRVAAQEPDRPPVMSREFWALARRSNAFGDASMWWGNWVPVATTGWGALFVIAPLVLANFLIWVSGARLSGHQSPDRTGSDDYYA